MSYRMGVDIGGTFTDLMIADEKGEIQQFKSPSTPEDPADGVRDVIKTAADFFNMSVKDLLNQTERIVHGTTVSTNAVVERNAAKTGLLCTDGFTHALYYREGGKSDVSNLKMPYVETYIPLRRTLGIQERIDSEGGIVVPLNEDSVRQATRQLKKWKVEAIGVCFIWSIVNPAHELRTGEIIEEEWPDIPYSLSHQVQPVIREFVRTSATALDASLKPIVSKYCDRLQGWLTDNGFKQEFLLVVATGGVMTVSEAKYRPVYIVFSGPTVGPMAGRVLAGEKGGHNLLIMDVGGTTLDVSTVIDGETIMTTAAMIADFPTGVSSVEITSIGAGGGSIAWVDSGGLLHVGPQSAGAYPGPACYDQGGQEATITDADIMLGYLNPEYFLGGKMKIYPELSQKVVEEKVARPLNIEITEASQAIFALVNQNMVNATNRLILKHGIDTRDFVLVAGGGAGPTHAAYIAKELGISRVIIPKRAAVFCAEGMVNLDARFSTTATCVTSSANFNVNSVNETLETLEEKVAALLESQGFPLEKRKFDYFAAARYQGQLHDLDISMPRSRVNNVQELANIFHETHHRRYSISQPESNVEFIAWTVIGTGLVDKLVRKKQPIGGTDTSKALKGRRLSYFGELGKMVDTPIYDGDKLVNGNVIKGPAIIEDVFSTPVIPSWAKVTVTELGDYYMQLG